MEVQVGSGADAMRISAVVVSLVAIERATEDRLLVHDCGEVDALVGIRLVLLDVLGSRDNVSLNAPILVHPDFRVFHLAAFALLMTDVEDEMRHLRLGIGEAGLRDLL